MNTFFRKTSITTQKCEENCEKDLTTLSILISRKLQKEAANRKLHKNSQKSLRFLKIDKIYSILIKKTKSLHNMNLTKPLSLMRKNKEERS